VRITALTQDVGFSLDAGALKKCPGARPFYFHKSSPQVSPHPKAVIPTAVQRLRHPLQVPQELWSWLGKQLQKVSNPIQI
jgi:hypothetical protein